MKFENIQKKVDHQIMQYGGYWRPLSMMNRLIEETGELARAINIKYGDKKSKGLNDGREIEKELADVLYTSVAIANSHNVSIINVDKKSFEKNDEPLEVLSGLIEETSRLFKAIKQDNTEMKNIILEIISEIIFISNTLEVDLETSFYEKIGEDVDKLNKVYK